MKTILVIVGIVVVLGVLIWRFSTKWGSGYSTTNTTSSPSALVAPALQNTVSMTNFAFSPAAVQVTPGATVTWTNNDAVDHSITSDTGAFSSPQLKPGEAFQFTFSSAGTFSYHCSNHPYMTAQVMVQ